MSELDQQVAHFRESIIGSGIVLDPEGTHHEFVSGMHGQKLDFDKIESGSPLYQEWVDVNAAFIKDKYPSIPTFILGVANGTNRLSEDVAPVLGGDVDGLITEKDEDNSKIIRLTHMADKAIRMVQPELVVVVEDVGTTGSNSVQAAVAAKEAGAKRVEVVTTWKRRRKLERLEEAGIPYQAIIDEPLTTYSPGECEAEGFCARGWEFIPRGK